MFTFLIVFLILFGIGCLIGFVYANIRYGIPTLLWIFKDFTSSAKEKCKEVDQAFEAKYGKPKPFLTALKEGWQEGWNSAKPRR